MWTALGAPGSRAQRLFKKPGLGRTAAVATPPSKSVPLPPLAEAVCFKTSEEN